MVCGSFWNGLTKPRINPNTFIRSLFRGGNFRKIQPPKTMWRRIICETKSCRRNEISLLVPFRVRLPVEITTPLRVVVFPTGTTTAILLFSRRILIWVSHGVTDRIFDSILFWTGRPGVLANNKIFKNICYRNGRGIRHECRPDYLRSSRAVFFAGRH